jgi:hypothetical protein
MAKPLGWYKCDICEKDFDAYNLGLVISRCCGTIHCPDCAKEAEKRGDYSPDGDCVDGDMVDASFWRRCKNCAPSCPNCGNPAEFEELTESFTETHGLDCGPYEQWTETRLVCSECRAETDDRELRQANKKFFVEEGR